MLTVESGSVARWTVSVRNSRLTNWPSPAPVPCTPVLERAGIRLDLAHREVYRDDRYVPLTPKEFGVLTELLRADGAVVSSEELLEKVWDEHTDPFTNTVRVTLMKLRRKLGAPPVIETMPRAGYRIS